MYCSAPVDSIAVANNEQSDTVTTGLNPITVM
jgi:hypothetical protein